MERLKDKLGKLDKFKYPLLVLILGVALMLFPGSSKEQVTGTDENTVLQQVLSRSEGVGEAQVIVSENGVVVVCHGAEDAKVRLNIIKAIGAYTGFGSDKIIILKMED